jgi:hypothetical protein
MKGGGGAGHSATDDDEIRRFHGGIVP